MKHRWLEIERDGSPFILLWSLLGWGIGIAVYWSHGWFLGFVSAMFSIGLIYFGIELIASSRIPLEVRIDADEVVTAFASAYPGDQVTSVALRAIEADRYVYSIRYRSPTHVSKPEARRYFAVSRTTIKQVHQLDTAEWWPRGLK